MDFYGISRNERNKFAGFVKKKLQIISEKKIEKNIRKISLHDLPKKLFYKIAHEQVARNSKKIFAKKISLQFCQKISC